MKIRATYEIRSGVGFNFSTEISPEKSRWSAMKKRKGFSISSSAGTFPFQEGSNEEESDFSTSVNKSKAVFLGFKRIHKSMIMMCESKYEFLGLKNMKTRCIWTLKNVF